MFVIEPTVLGAFVLAASAIVMSPGPDTMVILRHTLGSGRSGGHMALNGDGPKTGPSRALREAVLCNILNPKVIILFLALFPNFVDAGRGDVTAQLVTLAAILIVINVIWQTPMAWAADPLRRWLATPGRQTAVSRVSGSVLLFFAVLMLYENLF